MCNPVVMRGFSKSNHCSLHVLFRQLSVAFAKQIYNPLMRLKVLVPYRSTPSSGDHLQPDKCEEGYQYALRILEKMPVSRETAKLQMEFQIPIQHIGGTFGLGCSPHSFHDGLQVREIRLRLGREIGGQSFYGAAHLVKLNHILLCEIDHPGATAAFLCYESIVLQKINCLADCSLCDAEALSPFAFDNACAGQQRSIHDLCQQLFGQRLLDEAVGRE